MTTDLLKTSSPSAATVATILTENYRLLSEDGRGITWSDIQRDITRLFRSNAQSWMNLGPQA